LQVLSEQKEILTKHATDLAQQLQETQKRQTPKAKFKTLGDERFHSQQAPDEK
jgi:hypothetical protein